jgi:hypothetical protein
VPHDRPLAPRRLLPAVLPGRLYSRHPFLGDCVPVRFAPCLVRLPGVRSRVVLLVGSPSVRVAGCTGAGGGDERGGVTAQDELDLDFPEVPEEPGPVIAKATERQMLDLLHRRYGQVSMNGGTRARRYICAEHVRNRAGFFDRKDGGRTADFVAVDTWLGTAVSGGRLQVHGVEVKVSRSDWLRELKDPDKAAETLEYATHCWLAVPDPSIVRAGELPPGWGLLCIAGSRGLVARVTAQPRAVEPLTPSAIAALLRAAAKTAAALASDSTQRKESRWQA